MEPFIKDINKPMGGSQPNHDMPSRFRRWWANQKQKTRRSKRRIDRQNLLKESETED